MQSRTVDDDDGDHDEDNGPSGIHLSISRMPSKTLRSATWATSSLFGAILSADPRRTRKRRYLQDKLGANDSIACRRPEGC